MDKFIMPFWAMDVNLNVIKPESYCMTENFNLCGVTSPYESFIFLDFCYNQLDIIKNQLNDVMDGVIFCATTLWQQGRICETDKV
jgi:hypothetical protein